MATVQQIYNSLAFDLMEDPPAGLVLGLLTFDQFIDLLNLTILDLNTQTAIAKVVYTQRIVSGTAQYQLPDGLLRVDDVFCAGRLLSPATTQSLNSVMRGWRRATPGTPRYWHEDELPLRTIELVATPNYTGSAVAGGLATGFWVAGQSPAVHRNLTMVGPIEPPAVAELGDTIPLLSNDVALGYLGFGVLERVFSSDSELKDPQRSLFCHSAYQEGINALRAMMSEVDVDAGS